MIPRRFEDIDSVYNPFVAPTSYLCDKQEVLSVLPDTSTFPVLVVILIFVFVYMYMWLNEHGSGPACFFCLCSL